MNLCLVFFLCIFIVQIQNICTKYMQGDALHVAQRKLNPEIDDMSSNPSDFNNHQMKFVNSDNLKIYPQKYLLDNYQDEERAYSDKFLLPNLFKKQSTNSIEKKRRDQSWDNTLDEDSKIIAELKKKFPWLVVSSTHVPNNGTEQKIKITNRALTDPTDHIVKEEVHTMNTPLITASSKIVPPEEKSKKIDQPLHEITIVSPNSETKIMQKLKDAPPDFRNHISNGLGHLDSVEELKHLDSAVLKPHETAISPNSKTKMAQKIKIVLPNLERRSANNVGHILSLEKVGQEDNSHLTVLKPDEIMSPNSKTKITQKVISKLPNLEIHLESGLDHLVSTGRSRGTNNNLNPNSKAKLENMKEVLNNLESRLGYSMSTGRLSKGNNLNLPMSIPGETIISPSSKSNMIPTVRGTLPNIEIHMENEFNHLNSGNNLDFATFKHGESMHEPSLSVGLWNSAGLDERMINFGFGYNNNIKQTNENHPKEIYLNVVPV